MSIGSVVARLMTGHLYPRHVSEYMFIILLYCAWIASHGCPRADHPPGWRWGNKTLLFCANSSPQLAKERNKSHMVKIQ